MANGVPLHVCEATLRFALKHQDVATALSMDPDARVWIEIPIKTYPSDAPQPEGFPDETLTLELARAEVGLKVTVAPILARTAEVNVEVRQVDPTTGIIYLAELSDDESSISETSTTGMNGHGAASADTESLPEDLQAFGF